MTTLGVNVDHIATIREARKGREPDPIIAASLAELAGADGIVVHLREDRRHIQERDVRILRKTIQGKLDLEMAATDEMVLIAREVKPELVTIVPEKREELTTEGGLDVIASTKSLWRVIEHLHESGIVVALFIDPEEKQIETAAELGVDCIEIHTGRYANAPLNSKAQKNELQQIIAAAKQARDCGLSVNAGHGLNYQNVMAIAQIPEIEELNIGHSIISRAALVGIDLAVRDMKKLICKAGKSAPLPHTSPA